MPITWNDFDKIWAVSSPLTPYTFSDLNYAAGWNFIGSTPPARQMWDSLQKANDEKFKFLRDNFGTPNMVTTAAQMTDTDKIYVYVGSEAGWSNGHWYYYDAGTSTWVDGGVYNSTALVTDTTLTVAGKAADAKAVGDALALKADLAGATFSGNVAVNADFSTTGDATVGSDLTVSGVTTLTGNITAGADITVTGNITAGADITADDVTANGDLSIVGNATLSGVSTAVTPAKEDNSTNIATTAYVQTEIKPIEADVSVNDKRISNVEKLLQGNLYDYQTDSTSAYTKTVPAGVMPYASLDEVGGKTLVWNQWWKCNNNSTISDASGVTVQRNSADNSLTITGTASISKTIFSVINTIVGSTNDKLVGGHKYAVVFDSQKVGVRLGYESTDANHKRSYIITGTGRNYSRALGIVVEAGITYNETIRPMLCDLTIIFGSGNEPTINEFRAMFPAEYYEATAGELLSAGVTEIAVKYHSSLLRTLSIPTAVQQLDGYGRGAGTVSNVVNFERKRFIKFVKSVDLGTLGWEKRENNIGGYYFRNTTLNPKDVTDLSSVANIICSKLEAVSFSDVIGGEKDNVIGVGIMGEETGNVPLVVYISDNQGMTPAQFKESLSGVYLYYEQGSPSHIDISSILTNDNLFDVSDEHERQRITLTFKNINGDNYRIPVPSSETYMVDLQSAL